MINLICVAKGHIREKKVETENNYHMPHQTQQITAVKIVCKRCKKTLEE